MPGGARDQVVKFQSQAAVADGAGGVSGDWTDITNATTMAKVKAMPGREVVESDQVQGRAMYEVTIPNRRDITLAMRLVWVSAGNKVLNIRDLGEMGLRPTERVLLCEDGPVAPGVP